jgi:hypothetical protein
VVGTPPAVGAFLGYNIIEAMSPTNSNFVFLYYLPNSGWSWNSGGTAGPVSGYVVANFTGGGTVNVSPDVFGICGGVPCFTGTLTTGTMTYTKGEGYEIEGQFVNGTVSPALLAVLGLPSYPTEYNGAFSANLNLNGKWSTAQLTLETTVPEPGSLALFGTGLLGMAGLLRRKYFKV